VESALECSVDFHIIYYHIRAFLSALCQWYLGFVRYDFFGEMLFVQIIENGIKLRRHPINTHIT